MKKTLIVYLGLVFLFSLGFIYLEKSMGQQGNYLAAGYMLTPAIAAIFTRLFFYKNKFHDANLRFGKWRDYFKFWAFALIISVLSAVFYTILGSIRWDLSGSVFLGQLAQQFALTGQNINDLPKGLTPQIMLILYSIGGLTVFGIFPGIITGFGEEFGWRGLMFPLLYKIKPWMAFIVGGLIWYLWHIPLTLIIAPTQTMPHEQSVLNFLVLGIGSLCTFAFLAYVYVKSGSIWVVSFAHITIDNSQRVLSYFVVLQNQFLANIGLTLAMLVVVGYMLYTKKFKVFEDYLK